MERIGLRRLRTSDTGTEGVLLLPDGVFCGTLELPWRGNAPSVSCIPCGEYAAEIRDSPHFGKVYQVKDVPGRSFIEIHPGNFAGDVTRGLRSDVEGCILLGRSFGPLFGQLAILDSRSTVAALRTRLEDQPFRLRIEEEY